jgi:hypothetical protein
MSRKSDIELALNAHCAWRMEEEEAQAQLMAALGSAYDLGRAEQAEKDCDWVTKGSRWRLRERAKRLRAKVRKMAGETR